MSYDTKSYEQVSINIYQPIFRLDVCCSIPVRRSAPAPDLYRVASENLYFRYDLGARLRTVKKYDQGYARLLIPRQSIHKTSREGVIKL